MFSRPIQPIPSAPNIFFLPKRSNSTWIFFTSTWGHVDVFYMSSYTLGLPYRVFLIFTISPHFSSLAVSLCWASSSISGREVMISRCTPKGATLTTSSSWEQRSWNGNRESSTLQYQTHFSTQHYTWHTFPLTMLSSHLSWFRISCGISWYSLSPRPLKWERDRDWYTAWHNVWVWLFTSTRKVVYSLDIACIIHVLS